MRKAIANMPSLNQVSHAQEILMRDKSFMEQFSPNQEEKHMDMLWSALSSMTDKQYTYLLALAFSREYEDINCLLASSGCPKEGLIDPKIIQSPSDTSEDKTNDYDDKDKSGKEDR